MRFNAIIVIRLQRSDAQRKMQKRKVFVIHAEKTKQSRFNHK